MPNHKVYVLDPYHPDAISLLQNTPNVDVVLPTDPAKSNWHTDADGVILRSDTQLTASDFQAAKKLRVVVKQGVGVDNIDLSAAKSAGIAVHNTPALNSEAVAEFSLALTLSLSRRVAEFDRKLRNGEKLVRSQMLGLSLFQKKVGVVGMGNIGKIAARKWIGACEASIVGYDPVMPADAWSDIPHVRAKTLDEVVKECDVITLHVPLLDSTRGMIGAKELASMKKNSILVNCARGGVVDEQALLEEIKKGRIWGAVLDAVEVEPPSVKIDIQRELLETGKVIITPHTGASTMENQSRSGVAVVEELLDVLDGKENVPGKLV